MFDLNISTTAGSQSSHLLLSNFVPSCRSGRAVVIRDILPHRCGRIHFCTTDWFAKTLSDQAIVAGTSVEVVQRDGNTWLVVPASDSSA